MANIQRMLAVHAAEQAAQSPDVQETIRRSLGDKNRTTPLSQEEMEAIRRSMDNAVRKELGGETH